MNPPQRCHTNVSPSQRCHPDRGPQGRTKRRIRIWFSTASLALKLPVTRASIGRSQKMSTGPIYKCFDLSKLPCTFRADNYRPECHNGSGSEIQLRDLETS